MNTSNLQLEKRLPIFVLLVGLLVLAACSSDEDGVTPDQNSSPVIVFAVDALAVPKDSDATLKVNVTDPDGDDVSVHWQVTRNGQSSGTLDPAQQGRPTIAWVTPSTTGRDTITITATDGKGGTTTRVETIRVGTLKIAAVQSRNVPWNLSDSPFILRPTGDSFDISFAGSLNIQAGCDVLIDKTDLEIVVQGELRTLGTAQAPVSIQPNSRTPEPGWWVGIVASPDGPTPVVNLRHSAILYAKNAIYAVADSEVRLDGCRVMFSSEPAVLFQSSQDLFVVNTSITNNTKSAISIGGTAVTTLPDSIVISGDSLAVNGDITGGTPYSDQAAVYIDIPDYNKDVVIRVLENKIARNGLPGIQLVRASYPEIRDNSIFSNELGKTGQRYNIRLDNGFGAGGAQDTLDARYNYWGAPYTNTATDSLLIKQMIRDSEDGGGIAVRVVVYPWLHTPLP